MGLFSCSFLFEAVFRYKFCILVSVPTALTWVTKVAILGGEKCANTKNPASFITVLVTWKDEKTKHSDKNCGDVDTHHKSTPPPYTGWLFLQKPQGVPGDVATLGKGHGSSHSKDRKDRYNDKYTGKDKDKDKHAGEWRRTVNSVLNCSAILCRILIVLPPRHGEVQLPYDSDSSLPGAVFRLRAGF